MAAKMHWGHHKYDEISSYHEDYLGEYRVWTKMKDRCLNSKRDMYHIYGGRGIKICPEWLDNERGFINFYRDMGPRPKDGTGRNFQIDRIDPNGDYCPENCRWVEAIENAHNKRNNLFIYLFGERYCITEACRLFGINRTTVTEAVRVRKMSVEDAFVKTLERRLAKCAQ